jgi:3-deoxy-manno-octulosonate cytidylyltransferase (CMP-KDO synthetase)
MCTAVIIPVRMGATRLPNKPLADLGGVPLVVRVARQAAKCQVGAQVIVAAADQVIVDEVLRHGHDAVLTRAGHHSGTDRVAEVAAGLDCDIIINVQGDEPFVCPGDIDALVQRLAAKGEAMATLRRPLCDRAEWQNPNVVKVVCDDLGRALYFSRAAVPFERDGAPAGDDAAVPAGVWAHIGVYGYRRERLLALAAAPVHALERVERLEQLRAMAMGYDIGVVDGRSRAAGIDTPRDLEQARARILRLGEAAFPDA